MSDPLRADQLNAQPHADPERDAKIESLLLAGLDHYFSSDYAQAIDVWTRALFLDRNHARARAYIERARGAMAEQQRESEEMVHCGIAAFERGEMDAARQLLNAAVQRGGAHDVALAFLTRIDRLSTTVPVASSQAALVVRAPAVPASAPVRRTRIGWLGGVLALTALLLLVYGLASSERVRNLVPGFVGGADARLPVVISVQEPIVVPRGADLAIDRASALFAGGRPHDALRALDLVQAADPRRGDADKLRAAIQRELIAHSLTAPGRSGAVAQ